jgi:hypothetical protein
MLSLSLFTEETEKQRHTERKIKVGQDEKKLKFYLVSTQKREEERGK